jgi:hypothetical protein
MIAISIKEETLPLVVAALRAAVDAKRSEGRPLVRDSTPAAMCLRRDAALLEEAAEAAERAS